MEPIRRPKLLTEETLLERGTSDMLTLYIMNFILIRFLKYNLR